jgi:hypothetical protein
MAGDQDPLLSLNENLRRQDSEFSLLFANFVLRPPRFRAFDCKERQARRKRCEETLGFELTFAF